MTGFAKFATDKTFRAWLSAGSVDRGVGDGLTFVATEARARVDKASWILRYRYGGKSKEKVIGRYPDIPLKDARELARNNRGLLQQGADVAEIKRREKLKALDMHNVDGLAQIWYERHIQEKYKHPQVVERVIRRHIKPTIGKLPVEEVRPVHIDRVLMKIVAAGAPTLANDALRYMFRMFHFAVKRKWIESNPVYGFEIADAGGTKIPGSRWLSREELSALAEAMRDTPNFGRLNELSVWLLLALCVGKMAALGIDRFVAERALNHKLRDIEDVYSHHDYFDERKRALDQWARLLSATSLATVAITLVFGAAGDRIRPQMDMFDRGLAHASIRLP